MASAVRIYDNAVDITKSVDWKTIDMVSVLTKETGSLRFNMRQGVGQTYPAKTIPQIGDTIELYDSTGIIFGGTCTEVEPIISGLLVTWQVTCVDWGYLLDGTMVKKNYSHARPARYCDRHHDDVLRGKGVHDEPRSDRQISSSLPLSSITSSRARRSNPLRTS